MTNITNLSEYLSRFEDPLRIIYISSYIPRKCGIATFTKDLTSAINTLNPDALAEIVAISDSNNVYAYPWEVKFKLRQNNKKSYEDCAKYINQSSANLVVLQHEFGLYGGKNGKEILTLVNAINKPLITCFHSILPNPDKHKTEIITKIIEKSSAAIAMSSISRQALIDKYGCPSNKAVVIQHGVYDFTFSDPKEAQTKLNINNDFMIMVSGLMGPGKGFEHVIDAMPEILKINSNVKLFVVGETHPSIIQHGGRNYANFLIKKVADLHIQKNVQFINRFVDLPELIDLFKATDIYVTPHLDPEQPSSGTLAKAIGAGKVCISTPFNYAKEMLANEVGILVPFANSKSIAQEIINVINNKNLYEKYRRNAYKLGKTMQWPKIAQRHLNLFRAIHEKN